MQLCSQMLGAENVIEIDKLGAKSASDSLDESICMFDKDMVWFFKHIEHLAKVNTQLLVDASHTEKLGHGRLPSFLAFECHVAGA